MKNSKQILALLTAICFSACSYSQQTTDTFVKDSITQTSIISEGDLYEGTKSKEALGYYNKAHDYDANKDYKNAVKFYLKAIEADSGYVEAYDNLGLCHRKLGDYGKAEECYKKSIELYPKGSMARQNLAVVYALNKDYPSAQKMYVELIKMFPSDPEGFYGMANILMMQKEFDAALNYSLQAVDLYEKQKSPLLSSGQYMTGLIYYYKRDEGNAKKYLKLAKKNGAPIDPALQKELKL